MGSYLYQPRFNPIWQTPTQARAAAPTVRHSINNVAARHREVAQKTMWRMIENNVPLADIASFCKLAEQAACDCETRVENKANAMTSQEIDFRAAWPGAPAEKPATVSRANKHSSAVYGEWPGAV